MAWNSLQFSNLKTPLGKSQKEETCSKKGQRNILSNEKTITICFLFPFHSRLRFIIFTAKPKQPYKRKRRLSREESEEKGEWDHHSFASAMIFYAQMENYLSSLHLNIQVYHDRSFRQWLTIGSSLLALPVFVSGVKRFFNLRIRSSEYPISAPKINFGCGMRIRIRWWFSLVPMSSIKSL